MWHTRWQTSKHWNERTDMVTNMILFDLLWHSSGEYYSTQQVQANWREMWLLLVHGCHGRFVQRQPEGNPSVPTWHCQTSSIITDPNSDPISSSIIPVSSCRKSAHQICAYWTFRFQNTRTYRLTRQGQRDSRNTLTSLTAYSSGVTFSTSNTTASKLFFRSEEPLSLRDSELLLFWKTKTHLCYEENNNCAVENKVIKWKREVRYARSERFE